MPNFLVRLNIIVWLAFLKFDGVIYCFGRWRPDHNFEFRAFFLPLILNTHSSSSVALMIVIIVILVAVLILLVAIIVTSLSRTTRARSRRVSYVLISNVSVVAVLILKYRVVMIAKVFSPMILKSFFSWFIVVWA